MRHGCEQRWTDHAGQRSVRFLQARVKLFEAQALALEKAIEAGAFSGKMLFDLRLHRVGMRTGKHGFVGETEGVHRIELSELQVVARTSSSLGE